MMDEHKDADKVEKVAKIMTVIAMALIFLVGFNIGVFVGVWLF